MSDVTDDEIRELRESLIAEAECAGEAGVRVDTRELLADCNDALAEHSVHCGIVMCSTLCDANVDVDATRDARARLTLLLRARKEGK